MRQAWKLMIKCKRGDIVLAWFPHSDQATYKKRPALVVQRDGLNSGISQVVIAMITTNLTRLGPYDRQSGHCA
jgi:mRNA interferase MazF